MADECGLGYNLDNKYFETLDDSIETKSMASALPDGDPWEAKVISNTMVFALVYASAMCLKLVKQLYQYLSEEFNLYTSTDYLYTIWQPSVGLPDTRLPEKETTICEDRAEVKRKLKKEAIVTLEEFQDRVDETFPDSGIWLTYKDDGQQFRYEFRYPFSHVNGIRKRFTIIVHIPWFFIDPNNPSSSVMTWENLKSWFRDFVPAVDMIIPVYIEQDSYCIITSPANGEDVYIRSSLPGLFRPIGVNWRTIDTDKTVTIYHNDTTFVNPTDTSITKSFIDSLSNTITAENEITPIPILGDY